MSWDKIKKSVVNYFDNSEDLMYSGGIDSGGMIIMLIGLIIMFAITD